MARDYKTGIVITGDAKGGVKAIELTQKQLGALNQSAKKAGRDSASAFDGLKNSLLSVQGLLVGFGVGAFGAMVKSALDAGDQIQKLSIRLGASTEALSQYQHVADLTGVTFEALTTSWQRQTRRIAEAAAGTGAAKKALEELGLSAQALVALAPEKQFEVLADAVSNVALESDRVRLAQKLWDSEGVKLLQTIQGGSKALGEMRAEADRLGLTLTKAAADDMAAFNDRLTTIAAASEGFGRSITIAVLPALNAFLDELANVVTGMERFLDKIGLIESTSAGIRLTNLRDELSEVLELRQQLQGFISGEGGFLDNAFLSLGGISNAEEAAAMLARVNGEIQVINDQMLSLEQSANRGSAATQGAQSSLAGMGTQSIKTAKSITKVAAALSDMEKLTRKEISAASDFLSSLIEQQDKLRMTTEEYERFNAERLITGNVSEEMAAAIRRELAELQALRAGKEADAEASAASAKAAEEAAAEWQRTADIIEQSLTDALMRAFEGGASFAEAFREVLINMFKTLVLRPIVEFALSPIAGGAATAMGGGSGGFSISSIPSWFGSNSIGSGFEFAGSAWNSFMQPAGFVGPSSPGVFSGAGGYSNLAYGGAGLAGGVFGQAVFGGQGGTGGSLGATIGMAAGGPIGAAVGAVLGGFLGGLLGDDEPSPRYQITGPIGQAGIGETQDMEPEAAQKFLDIVNEYEARFISMLSDAQREAIEGFVPPAGSMAHIESEHELVANMVTRVTDTLEEIDMDIATAWNDKVQEIHAAREFTMEDAESLMNDWLGPVLYLQQRLSQVTGAEVTGADAIALLEGADNAEEMAVALVRLATVLQADPIDEYREAVRKSHLGMIDSLTEQAEALVDLSKEFDGSVEATNALTESYVEMGRAVFAALAVIDAAVLSIHATTQNTIDSINMDMMSREERVQKRWEEARALYAGIDELQSPEEVSATINKINSLIQAGWAEFTDAEKQAYQGFITNFLQAAEDKGQVALENMRREVEDGWRAISAIVRNDIVSAGEEFRAIVTGAASEISGAADSLASAAQSMRGSSTAGTFSGGSGPNRGGYGRGDESPYDVVNFPSGPAGPGGEAEPWNPGAWFTPSGGFSGGGNTSDFFITMDWPALFRAVADALRGLASTIDADIESFSATAGDAVDEAARLAQLREAAIGRVYEESDLFGDSVAGNRLARRQVAADITAQLEDIDAYRVALVESYRRQIDELQAVRDDLVQVSAGIIDQFKALSEALSTDLGGTMDLAALREVVYGAVDLTDSEAIQDWLETADEYRQALLDQGSASQQAASGARSGATAVQQFGDQILSWVAQMRAAGLVSAAPGIRLGATQSMYESTLGLARRRDQGALEGLTGSAQRYIEAARGGVGSAVEFERIFGRTLADVERVGRANVGGSVSTSARHISSSVSAASEVNSAELKELQDLVDQMRQEYEATVEQQIADYDSEILQLQEEAVGYLEEIKDYMRDLFDILNTVDPSNIGIRGPGDPGFAAGGIAIGPRSGYPALLHGTEAIIPLDSGPIPVRVDMRELAQEVRELREEVRTIGAVQVRHAEQSARSLRKWDVDGLPATRT